VKEATVTFFRNHFGNEEWNRPNLHGVSFPTLAIEDASLLEGIFSMGEIEAAVKASDGSKCPGPDGFNYAFIKEFWGLMKYDVRILFDQFHGNECIPKCLLSYFLTLVPKVKSPQRLKDFRPISLLGCVYKLIAKVLAARLAKVLSPLVSKSQSAFLKGRQLVEGVVVVNEVIDYAKKSGKECLILKVDFEKAYDSVDWKFLDYVLQRFGFGRKWRAWMRACVCGGNMSVLVNGSPTEEISIKRGLKQGDPLAPLLFLLVAEGLGAIMRKAVAVERFKPFLVGRGQLPISILQYADDTLCIGEASVGNLWTLKAILRGFELASGLKVNFFKSCIIGVNISNEFLDMASNFLNCRIGCTPFKYLGLMVGGNPRSLTTWEPMLNTIRSRLGSWGNNFVSLGGRIVLLNSVLSAIPIFYLSFLKMPMKVWREVVKIQRKFLWSGLADKNKTCWVKWEDICKPKKEGGLGVRDLRLVNISLLTKWRWRLLDDVREVWKGVIVSKYGGESMGSPRPGIGYAPHFASRWWIDICSLDKDADWFVRAVVKKVGSGNKTKFWIDTWIGEQPLRERFPRLFEISCQKEGTIASFGSWSDLRWCWNIQWRRQFFVWEQPMCSQLYQVIAQFQPSLIDDSWHWKENMEDGFTVKSCYELLYKNFRVTADIGSLKEFVFSNVWRCAAPSKVCSFSWQLLLERIPTKDNLWKRRMLLVENLSCVFCDLDLETPTHLFLHCSCVSQVWHGIMNWIGVVLISPPNLDISLAMFVGCAKNKAIREGLALVWNAVAWVIWKSRNARIFNNKTTTVEEMVDQVQLLSWRWFLNRKAKSPCLLYEWKWSPLDCFIL
jgi:hypothetical protein